MPKPFKTSKRSRLMFLNRLADLMGEYRANIYAIADEGYDAQVEEISLDFGCETIGEFKTSCLERKHILELIEKIEQEPDE